MLPRRVSAGGGGTPPVRLRGSLLPELYLPLIGFVLWTVALGAACAVGVAAGASGLTVGLLGAGAALGAAALAYLVGHENSVVLTRDTLRRPTPTRRDPLREIPLTSIRGVRLEARRGRAAVLPLGSLSPTVRRDRALPVLQVGRAGGPLEEVELPQLGYPLTERGARRAGDGVQLLARLAGVVPDLPDRATLRQRLDARERGRAAEQAHAALLRRAQRRGDRDLPSFGDVAEMDARRARGYRDRDRR